MNNLPPLPESDLSVFRHPLAKPYRFFAWDFEVYEEDTLLCLFDCLTGEWAAREFKFAPEHQALCCSWLHVQDPFAESFHVYRKIKEIVR